MKKLLCSFLCLSLLVIGVFAGGSEAGFPQGDTTNLYAPDGVITVGEVYGVAAKSYILTDLSTGEVLEEKNADEILPPASITKIMTLLLVIEAAERGEIAYTDTVTASEHASKMGGAQIFLKVGEQMTVEELFKAVSIASANDAAVALAEHVAGSEEAFVARMNDRAKELGMTNTTFRNACGLDQEGHLTTARDIAKMSYALCQYEKAFTYTTTWMDSVRSGAFELVNTNKLIRTYRGITGLKTGSTSKAGCCISATAKRDNISLCAVVMGCETGAIRFESAAALLNHGFAAFEQADLVGDTVLSPIPVTLGVQETVPLCFGTGTGKLIPRGKSDTLTRILTLPQTLNAPITAGTPVGTLTVSLEGEVIGEVPILAAESVQKLTFWQLFTRFLGGFSLC